MMRAALLFAAFLVAALGNVPPSAGQDVLGRDAIVRGLTPKPLTRNLSVVAPPSVTLDIEFQFDSAALTDQAVRQIDELGAALTSQQLNASAFEIDGHTDGHGTPSYNQTLSERRAGAVRDYLASKFGVAADRLRAVGFGFSRLKVASDPFDPTNRRVEIINLTRPTS